MKHNALMELRKQSQVALGILLLGLMAGCESGLKDTPSAAPTAAKSAPASVPVKLLKLAPEKGKVGDSFSITGEGLAANKEVQFQWKTTDGGYATKVFAETIEFYERKFEDKRILLGRATTDAQGRLSATFTVPDDFGEVHDVYATENGRDVARGGYRILPEFSLTPLEGPVGTPITIKAKGIGWKNWESTWGVNWDNKYTGYITAITTRGSATAVIRAAGTVGPHTIDIWHAGQTVPYLNWEESPQSHIPVFKYTFKITGGSSVPASGLNWPDKGPGNVAVPAMRTTVGSVPGTAGASAVISPAAGPVLSKANLRATNLPANATVELSFVTARGSRTSGLGWGLAELPLGKATTGADGSLNKEFDVPDDLGGWHTVKIAREDKLLAQAPFLVQPSLVTVTPTRVKAGDSFKVNIKGVGWTEIDNIYGVLYDNGYIGFACGFNSNGNITINLRASGEPGVHLIDLYPAVYQGHGKPPWLYDTPMLTALTDHPGLALGYRLPVFRLAIEIIK